jgi:hypothetical protein
MHRLSFFDYESKGRDIPNQLEKAYFQVPLNGLGFIRGARRSPLMCKGRLALAFKLSLK